MIGVSACGFVNDNNSGPSASTPRNGPLEVNEDIVNSKLAPPKGFVSKNLFTRDLGTDDRLDRLENVVQQLHDSLSGYMPAIQNISEIDGEIQDLITQLKTLVDEPAPAVAAQPPINVAQQPLDEPDVVNAPIEADSAPIPVAPPQQPAPVPQAPVASKPEPTPVPASAAPVAVATGGAIIRDIRVSQGGGKTRVVFDSNKMIDYMVDYDAQEGLVLVSAKGATLTADPSVPARKSSKITSISQSNDGGAMNIIFSLNGSAQLSKGTLLKPNKDSSEFHYFFDISD